MRIIALFRTGTIVSVIAMTAQALFAGEILAGRATGVKLHLATARFLVLCGVLQAGIAIALRMKRTGPRWLLFSAFGVLAAEIVEYGLGEYHNLLLHVPLALLIFGGTVRQMIWALKTRGCCWLWPSSTS